MLLAACWAIENVFGLSNEAVSYANTLREQHAAETGKAYKPVVRPERKAGPRTNKMPFTGAPKRKLKKDDAAAIIAPPSMRLPPGYTKRVATPPTVCSSPVPDSSSVPSSPTSFRSGPSASKGHSRPATPPPPPRSRSPLAEPWSPPRRTSGGSALHTSRYAPWLTHALHVTHTDSDYLCKSDHIFHHREPPPLSPSGHPAGDYITPALQSRRWAFPANLPRDQSRANRLLEQRFEANLFAQASGLPVAPDAHPAPLHTPPHRPQRPQRPATRDTRSAPPTPRTRASPRWRAAPARSPLPSPSSSWRMSSPRSPLVPSPVRSPRGFEVSTCLIEHE